MATSASARVGTIDELLPLEGDVSTVWKYFGFPARNGKFLEPDKKKRKQVHCKILSSCVQLCPQHDQLVAAPPGIPSR